MTRKELMPWKWGGLRRWGSEDAPLESFRRQMDSLHQEMERLFDDMAGGGAFRASLFPRLQGREQMMPELDVSEDDKAFHVSIELPGMDEKDVDVTLSGRTLSIRGEKKQDEKEQGKDFYRRERVYGAFRRLLEVPGDVDESKIGASFRNGVLKVDLPKSKEAQARVKRIDVKAA